MAEVFTCVACPVSSPMYNGNPDFVFCPFDPYCYPIPVHTPCARRDFLMARLEDDCEALQRRFHTLREAQRKLSLTQDPEEARGVEGQSD